MLRYFYVAKLKYIIKHRVGMKKSSQQVQPTKCLFKVMDRTYERFVIRLTNRGYRLKSKYNLVSTTIVSVQSQASISVSARVFLLYPNCFVNCRKFVITGSSLVGSILQFQIWSDLSLLYMNFSFVEDHMLISRRLIIWFICR